jgi:hypothetical protein
MSFTCAKGIALVSVLLISTLVCTIALGLSLVVSVHQLIVRNHYEEARLVAAANAGLELAALKLETADWNGVLQGLVQAAGSDGAPSGAREISGGQPIDLSAETNLLNCRSALPCSAPQLGAVTLDRPWGANNPEWQLFLYGPVPTFVPLRFPPAIYLLVWIGDDARETDGDAGIDGGGADEAGRDVLRVHAAAFGRDGGRRAFEAELLRICRPGAGGPACLPAVRVQSRRDLREALP